MKPRHAARAALVALTVSTAAVTAAPAQADQLPTIVLVHGAFTDTTSWDRVAAELRADGYRVVTPDNPLRGPANDAAAIQRTLDTVAGPVVLVGHSYGGTVITNVHDPKVQSLVYIAALAPTRGEIGLAGIDPIRFPGSQLISPALQIALVDDPNGIGGKNLDSYVVADRFHAVFAQDVPAETAAELLTHQRSLATTANLEPSGDPSWATTPSWYLVSTADNVVPTASQRFMANRMGAHTSEIDSSHSSMISHPDAVAAIVEAAAEGAS